MTGFVVINTNVLVSGMVRGSDPSPPRRIVEAMIGGHLRFVLSETLLGEYRRVLLRQPIAKRHGLSEAGVDGVLLEVVVNATMRQIEVSATGDESTGRGTISVPAGDAHVVALLRSMPGCGLVTGDGRLADAVRAWCEVMTPTAFAANLPSRV